MNKLEMLQKIEVLGEEMGYYGNLSEECLEHELEVNNDKFFVGANICGYYADQDGGEVDDDFYDCVVELLEELVEENV